MSRKLGNITLPIVVLVAAIIIAKALIASRPPVKAVDHPMPVPLVEAFEVGQTGTDISIHTQGTVSARNDQQLTSDVAGRITWVNPELLTGNILDANTVIAKVDRSAYELALAQANLALRDAELSLADARTRFKTRDPHHPQIRRAEAQVAAARAQIEKAGTDLSRTEVVLPNKALIASRQIALGQYVAPGTVLAKLQDVDTADVALPLTQRELEIISAVQNADVELRPVNGSSTRWQAKLARVQQQLDKDTRVAYAVAEVTEPYSLTPPLRFGQFVEAQISGIHMSDAYSVPLNALFENQFVYRINADSRLETVTVQVISQNADIAVIRADLSPGDRIVISRLDIMANGMRVRVKE